MMQTKTLKEQLKTKTILKFFKSKDNINTATLVVKLQCSFVILINFYVHKF